MGKHLLLSKKECYCENFLEKFAMKRENCPKNMDVIFITFLEILTAMGEKQSETPLARGKTKAIFAMKDNPELVLIESFDSLTAFNAKRKDTVSGKAAAATRTTCNVFQFLSGAGSSDFDILTGKQF